MTKAKHTGSKAASLPKSAPRQALLGNVEASGWERPLPDPTTQEQVKGEPVDCTGLQHGSVPCSRPPLDGYFALLPAGR